MILKINLKENVGIWIEADYFEIDEIDVTDVIKSVPISEDESNDKWEIMQAIYGYLADGNSFGANGGTFYPDMYNNISYRDMTKVYCVSAKKDGKDVDSFILDASGQTYTKMELLNDAGKVIAGKYIPVK